MSESQEIQIEGLSNQSTDSQSRGYCQTILLEAYREIGEPDGVYGVGVGYSSDVTTRIQTYEHEREFGKALCKFFCTHLQRRRHLLGYLMYSSTLQYQSTTVD